MTWIPPEAVAARLRAIRETMRPRRYVEAAAVEPPVEWANAPQPSGIDAERGGIEVIETRFGDATAEPRFVVTCECGKRWWQTWPCPEVDRCPRCRAVVEITITVPA